MPPKPTPPTTTPPATTAPAGTTADTTAATAAPPASGNPAAPSGEDAGEQLTYAFPVPAEYRQRPGVDLLMEACSLYNIDPDENAVPVQLLNWKFYAGDRRQRRPDRVALVTAGGLKLAHPADEDTVDRLRRVFHCYHIKKNKDGSEEQIITELPEDLSLPTSHLTGLVETEDHVYRRGYLQEGGGAQASARAARRNANLPR